jgi:hypothetical protein
MRVDLNVSTFAHFLTLHVALQVAQAECRLWVKRRNTRYEQMYSALTLTADILGERAVHGAFPFQLQHYANSPRAHFLRKIIVKPRC